jgi:amino acid adenylation domain-containing protein
MSNSSINISSFVDILRLHAEEQADSTAFIALSYEQNLRQDTPISYGELDRRARSIAARLQQLKLRDQRVLLIFPQSLDFVATFYGCLYAGVIAVPIHLSAQQKSLQSLEAIASNSSPTAILTNSKMYAFIKQRLQNLDVLLNIQLLITDQRDSSQEDLWQPYFPNGDAISHIQYTSGSTGVPKGVVLTHGNLIHNSQIIKIGFDYKKKSDCREVSWLPHYHDMGLVGNVIFPVYMGGMNAFMSPRDFIQKPLRWLQAIMGLNANTSGGPNFAYELCLQKIRPEELTTLSLEGWKIAYSGSETVRAETIKKFSRFFKPCGFSEEAFYPCYGMAEATLFITGGAANRKPRVKTIDTEALAKGHVLPVNSSKPGRDIVSCGSVFYGQTVKIVNPETFHYCKPNEIGEIWVNSSSIGQAYFGSPSLSQQTFSVCSAMDNQMSFLRTGDLGFLDEGELFVTGRLKDLIIIRGRNFSPQDIEWTVENCHPYLATGGAAAFTIDVNNEERLVIIQEIERSHLRKLDTKELSNIVYKTIVTQHELVPYAIAFLKPMHLPKTSSGKVKRSLCRQKYLNNSFEFLDVRVEESAIASSPDLEAQDTFTFTQTSKQESLLNLISSLCRIDSNRIDIFSSLSQLGLDSLKIIEFQYLIENEFNVHLPLQTFIEDINVDSLIKIIQEETSTVISRPAQFGRLFSSSEDEIYHPFPLTDIQQAYLLGRNDSFELGNVSTHVYLEFEVDNINIVSLNRALKRLIDRHDMLRAVILSNGQQQILKEVPPYEIDVLDLQGRQDAQIALASLREELSHQVLPENKWPLFDIRATILDHKVLIHISLDALCMDALSMYIFSRELAKFYRDSSLMLPAIEFSFRDCILARAQHTSSTQYKKSEHYWFNRFNSLPPAPDFPLACQPTSIEKPQFKRYEHKIQKADWERLKQQAAKLDLTPSGLLLAAFARILTKWNTRTHFTINTTLFSRSPIHPQVNQIIGDFTSLLLVEVDNSQSSSFIDEAKRLQKQLWQDLEYRHICGVRVLRELTRYHKDRHRGTMPVVFTSLIGLSQAQDTFEEPNQHIGKLVYSITQTPQVWIDHQVHEDEGALVFNWDVLEALFPKDFISEMFAAYCSFLDRLITSDKAWEAIATKGLLSPEHLAARLQANSTESHISTALLHELFMSQVAKHADQYAVLSPSRKITYRELFQLANRVGYQLRNLGVKPNTLVGIVMAKGWEQVVATLGILFSGAAYLPIDRTVPHERLKFILEHGEVNILLTQSGLVKDLRWLSDIHVLGIDDAQLDQWSDAPLLESVQTHLDLAYVIYTSGSTGLPKGVMIDHRGAVNTITDINQKFHVTSQDRVLAVSSLHFDLSVYDIFGLLAVGGCIVIPSDGEVSNPSHWISLIEEFKITVWNSVPTLAQILIETQQECPEADLHDSLRLFLLSGDWIPPKLPEKITQFYEMAIVAGLGGATEASIWSNYYVTGDTTAHLKSIPYGRPLSNQCYHVVDEFNEPSPTWVPGQLLIGGIGLAKGYWKDEDKTNKSFFIHPQTNSRLYKTGDLGRYLPDGDIEFMGRQDFQVKINGFRIELGEIEAILETHDAVKQAIVTLGQVKSSNKYLIAYVILNENTSDQSQALQKVVEAYHPNQLKNIIQDPIERIEFKLKRKGLQRYSNDYPKVKLFEPAPSEQLGRRYTNRKSHRIFLDQAVPFTHFGQFIACLSSLEEATLPKYQYPSAGSLYPVQVYLYVKWNGVENIEPGFYYYHPQNHCLVFINSLDELDAGIYGPNQRVAEHSAFSVFLIGELNAIEPMYGKLTRDFCLLEAGYMGQLMMTSASESRIGLCPIGYFESHGLRKSMNLEPSQVILHSFVGGSISMDQDVSIQSEVEKIIPISPIELETELQTLLMQKLPYYMLPKHLIVLKDFPLTPNGKLDRKALPMPDVTIGADFGEVVLPRTRTEETLIALFANILGIEKSKISIHSNFLSLGGDSLQAIKLITELRSKFWIEIPLRRLFEISSIADFCEYIDAATQASSNFLDLPDVEIEEGEF